MLKGLTSKRSEPNRRKAVSLAFRLCVGFPALVLALAVAPGSPNTESPEDLEYRVKAAYL